VHTDERSLTRVRTQVNFEVGRAAVALVAAQEGAFVPFELGSGLALFLDYSRRSLGRLRALGRAVRQYVLRQVISQFKGSVAL